MLPERPKPEATLCPGDIRLKPVGFRLDGHRGKTPALIIRVGFFMPGKPHEKGVSSDPVQHLPGVCQSSSG